MSQAPLDTLILGAGVAGLTLAFRLAARGRSVAVLDSASRAGGVIGSKRVRGFLIETGPNSFTSAPHMDALIDDLGLRDQALVTPLRDHDRFVWKQGRLRKVPTGPLQLLTSDVLSFPAKVRLLRGLFARFPAPQADLALADFFRRRLGPDVVDSLLKPFLAGVYAADADRVSFEATFTKLYSACVQHPSLLGTIRSLRSNAPKGPRPVRALCSFTQGLSTLTDALDARVVALGGEVRSGLAPPARIERLGDGWAVRLGDDLWQARQLVLATPADAAAQLLAPYAPPLAEWLGSIEYAPLTIVHVGLPRPGLRESRNGFGYLTVADQGVEALGMIWNDQIFTHRVPAGERLMTCFYGGEKRPAANALSDAELRTAVEKDLTTVMGWTGRSLSLFEVTRWKRALPIFRVNHAVRQRLALTSLPSGVHLLGNYLGGVSLPDRVLAAEQLAESLLQSSLP
jgi:oxygen-dependent protoporphyrinogen oxidase